MANQNQFVSLGEVLRQPLVDKDGNPSKSFSRKLQEYDNKLNGTINLQAQIIGQLTGLLKGTIDPTTVIVGRTEGVGTTVININSAGKLISTDSIAADGTGSPLTGGKRAAIGFDPNSRLVSSFHANPVDISSIPVSSTQLSNTGTATVISVAAGSYQFGPGSVAYNSGSVDPGAYGKYYVYFDDPTFAGGAVTFQASLNPVDTVSALGRILVGIITTAGGSGTTGGGHSGSGSGGRGYNPN